MNRIHGKWLAGAAALIAAVALVPHKATKSAGKIPLTSQKVATTAAHTPGENSPPPSRRPLTPSRRILSELPKPIEFPEESGPLVDARIAELDRLSWFNDPESMLTILSEMRSSLPEIRAAALSSIKAFSSRDSIPYLEAITAETRDPKQKEDLSEAIEYLRLPTLVEELDRQEKQEGQAAAEAPNSEVMPEN
jgi:hypothetical protein